MTTTPTTFTFIGAKGGVGTSTVAAMYALTVARRSDRLVRLTASHDAGVEDSPPSSPSRHRDTRVSSKPAPG